MKNRRQNTHIFLIISTIVNVRVSLGVNITGDTWCLWFEIMIL